MGHETSTYLDLQNCQESAMTDSALTSLVFFFKNIRLDLIQQLQSARRELEN